MSLLLVLSFAGALASLVLGAMVLLKKHITLASVWFGVGMVLLGAETVFAGLSATAATAINLVDAIWWQHVKLLLMAWLPGIWLTFSLCYSRGNYREFLAKSKTLLIGAFLVPISLSLLPREYLLMGSARRGDATIFLDLGIAGVALHILLLISLVLTLVNLERTLRTAAGTMRWRIKFVVLGFAVVFGMRIYTSSQAVLFTAVPLSLVELQAIALLVGCGLMALSFRRAGLREVDVYPSQSFLYASLTITLTGIYLLVVGLFAKIVDWLGLGDSAFPAKAFVILVALVGLALLLLSDRIRQQAKRFISRHLRRPLHDYRIIWTNFTGRTVSLGNPSDVCAEVVRMISETFHVLSVTIWLVDEQMQQLVCSASTSLSGSKISDRAGSPAKIREMLAILSTRKMPFDIDASTESWVQVIKEFTPDYFKQGGNRICVPLVAADHVLGLMTLGDRVSGAVFSTDDFDLLHCMGDQVAATLLNVQLSAKLLQVKELEAFQAMAAFFVHDLKNTASTLSLMLENLPKHFNNPAFREDALRSIGATVKHVNDLISRLTVLRHGLQISPVESDLNELVTSSLDSVRGASGIESVTNLGAVPRIAMDPSQMRNVIVNLLLNAKEAIGTEGQIKVESTQSDPWAILRIADNGPGMSPEFMNRSLFRPFQTTKKKGLGIGLFQSKMIVEAHRGKLEVESEVGKGTAFRVLLPLNGSTTDESKIADR